MKKKIAALVLSGVLTASLLTGCGSTGENQNEGQGTAADSQTSDSPADSGTADDNSEAAVSDEASAGSETLTVWCWDPAYNINALRVAESIYQKDNPNFKLEIIETNAEDISTKMATATTSGEYDVLPDILLFDDGTFQVNVTSYPDVFLDLTPYGFNYDEFSPGKVGFSTIDGKHYGIPFDSGTAIACYRTDILEQAGYTIDDFTDITWSEWIEKAKVVLDKTGCPLLNGMSAYNQITVMLQSAGGSFFNENGEPDIASNEIVKAVVETYAEMVQSGVYTEETGWDTYIGGMNTGRIAGAMNGCWIMASIQAAEDQSGLWEITNIPKLDGIASATNYSSQGGSSWAITSKCANPELAVDFFKATFGGSTELYDEILATGAISTWLPAAESEKYAEPVAFYNNQPVFSIITTYSASVPECYVGVYFQNARYDVVNAITNIIYSDGDIESELQAAEETLIFEMEQK